MFELMRTINRFEQNIHSPRYSFKANWTLWWKNVLNCIDINELDTETDLQWKIHFFRSLQSICKLVHTNIDCQRYSAYIRETGYLLIPSNAHIWWKQLLECIIFRTSILPFINFNTSLWSICFLQCLQVLLFSTANCWNVEKLLSPNTCPFVHILEICIVRKHSLLKRNICYMHYLLKRLTINFKRNI